MNRWHSKRAPTLLLEDATARPGYKNDPARVCRPLGDFLLWAVERGLAPGHTPALDRIRFAPGVYVVDECDSSLSLNDFEPRAHAFLRRVYEEYRVRCPMTPDVEDFLDLQLRGANLPTIASAGLPEQPDRMNQETRGELSVASLVMHPKFGTGHVIDTDGQGPEAKLLVRFEGGEEKRLLARFITRRLPE